MDEQKVELVKKVQQAENMYTLISEYTKMPYVVCDEKTFDDEMFLFFSSEAAAKEAERLVAAGNPVRVGTVENQYLLDFFSGLFPIGINCLCIDKGTDTETSIQLNELIRRANPEEGGEEKAKVENPEFHLTALYFTQEYRKNPQAGMSEELNAIYEEMQAHFAKGEYIVATEEGKGIPMLKHKDGKTFLPLSTDFHEFRKMNYEGKMGAVVVKAGKISELMTDEVTGVAINPFGVNILLNWEKQQ